MPWKIPLADPDIGREEIEAVTRVLQGKWLTMGPVTEEFELRFAEKLNVKHAFAVNNCTAALHLANIALGIGPGDEVICPALTFVASANATRYTGGKVVFADVISEEELNVDPIDIEQKITANTRAITLVHYAGYPCRMDKILALARKHRLKIIEDCAHAPFVPYRFADGTRKYVGTIGDVGCFSFFGNKNMTTGEGGMVTTNDDELASKIKLLRSHGMTTLTYDRYKGHASSYDVVALGYNYRLDDIRSAVGLAQLSKVDKINARRQAIVLKYREAFANHPNIIVPFHHHNVQESSCHIMPVIVKTGELELRARLREAGIQTSKHYELIPEFGIYKESRFETRFPLLRNIITLPLYHSLTDADIAYIRRCFDE